MLPNTREEGAANTPRQGWLSRLGSARGAGWKRFWCVLVDRDIFWYEDAVAARKDLDRDEPGENAVGLVQLECGTQVATFRHGHQLCDPKIRRDRPFGFWIDPRPTAGRNRELFCFDAADTDSLSYWMRHISTALKLLQEQWVVAESTITDALATGDVQKLQVALHQGLAARMDNRQLSQVWIKLEKVDLADLAPENQVRLLEQRCMRLEGYVNAQEAENKQLADERGRVENIKNRTMHRYRRLASTREVLCKETLAGLRRDASTRGEVRSRTQDAIKGSTSDLALDLSHRGLSLGQLLDFMLEHGLQDGNRKTREVVRDFIIPLSKTDLSAMADLLPPCMKVCNGGRSRVVIAKGRKQAKTFVSHCWAHRFFDTVSCIAQYVAGKADANITSFDPFTANDLEATCWICIFAVNQHYTVCGSKDFPCDCRSPKWPWGTLACEVDKFSAVLQKIPDHLVVMDASYSILNRLWVLTEIYEQTESGRNTACFGPLGELTNFPSVISAKCTDQADEVHLMARVRNGPGIESFDEAVQKAVRGEVQHRRFFNAIAKRDWKLVVALHKQDGESRLITCTDPANSYRTAVHCLCAGNDDDPEALQELLDLKADVNAREGPPFQKTALHLAAERGHINMATTLCTTDGCDIGARALPSGESAAEVALARASGKPVFGQKLDNLSTWSTSLEGQAEASKVREKHLTLHAKLTDRPWVKNTLKAQLFRACVRGDVFKVDQLLSNKPDLAEARDENFSGYTALHHACCRCGAEALAIVLELVSRKADTNVVSARVGAGMGVGMWTPLHCASYAGCGAVVSALLELKANPRRQDSLGNTAEDWALLRQNVDAMNAIMRHAAADT